MTTYRYIFVIYTTRHYIFMILYLHIRFQWTYAGNGWAHRSVSAVAAGGKGETRP